MICPNCNSDQSMVIDSRQMPQYRYRRQKCLACGERFSTKEIVVDSDTVEKVKCKNCVLLQKHWCEKVADSPDEDLERYCRHFKQKTKADRARSLTDEELAELLFRVAHAQNKLLTKKEWLEILKKPAKEA